MKRVIRSNRDLADFQAAVKDRINYLEEEDVNSTIRINAAEDDEDEYDEEAREQAYSNYINDIHNIAEDDATDYGLTDEDIKSYADAVTKAAENEGWFYEYDDPSEPPTYEDARVDYDASDAVYALKQQYEEEPKDANYYREQYMKNKDKFTHIYSDEDIANYILDHWSLNVSKEDDTKTIIDAWIDQGHEKFSSLNDSFAALNSYVNDDLLDALNILREAVNDNTECFPDCIYRISQQEELYRMWYWTHVVK